MASMLRGFTGMPGFTRGMNAVLRPLRAVTTSDAPDVDAVASEIAAFTPRLRAFALSLGNDEAEADDLVQETCLRALRARDRFVPGTNLKAWLFTILRNLHLNRRRDIAARPNVVALEELGTEHPWDRTMTSAEHTALARTQVADVARALRELPSPLATPLHLAAVEDMPYAAIAELLDIPVGTVMSRIYRARRLLLSRFADHRP
jgi:RNA polymerase sigma-70 factor, ECF subfamily